MGRVFLSYARDDLRRAAKVAEALEAAGHEVWWDSHLKGGSEYSREIDEALKSAEAVVVLWSQTSVEFRMGPGRGRRRQAERPADPREDRRDRPAARISPAPHDRPVAARRSRTGTAGGHRQREDDGPWPGHKSGAQAAVRPGGAGAGGGLGPDPRRGGDLPPVAEFRIAIPRAGRRGHRRRSVAALARHGS